MNTSPSDLRLVTNIQSWTHVPEGHINVRAEAFGATHEVRVTATLDGVRETAMSAGADGTWSCDFADVSDGLHELCVSAVSEREPIKTRSRSSSAMPGSGQSARRPLRSVAMFTPFVHGHLMVFPGAS
jgi:hypothetical protein